METSVKRTSILDIIRNNAEVVILHNHPQCYQDTYDVHKCKLASVLVNTKGKVCKPVALTRDGINGSFIYKSVGNIYATEGDLLNENPIYEDVDVEWLKAEYEFDRPVYYIDHRNQICNEPHGTYIRHINLITGEITYEYNMTPKFFTIEELKASRPDLFPPKKRVRITTILDVEVNEKDAKELMEFPEVYSQNYDDSDAKISAEIID